MHNLRQYTVPLQRYMALMDLQVIQCSVLVLVLYCLEMGADVFDETFRRGMRDCFISF